MTLQPIRVFPYGVARSRLLQAAKRLGVPVMIARDIDEADVMMTLRTHYRARQSSIIDAEERHMPIYVLRANTISQVEQSLAQLFNLQEGVTSAEEWEAVSAQTQAAIEAVINGQRYADLPDAPAAVRRMQHEMARQAQLTSQSYGKDPHRRVRIYRD